MNIIDIRQRHLEAIEVYLEENNVKQGMSRNAGVTVRGAIVAGWFGDDSPTVESVDDMTGGEVRRLANLVNEAYNKAVQVTENLS